MLGMHHDVTRAVHYLPLLTTAISAAFVFILLRRASRRGWAPHLMWWAVGVFFYGVGTALESAITLVGNGPGLNRWWYLAGAVLGGYPLATGTVYLLLPRRRAHAVTAASLALVAFAGGATLLSPMDAAGIAAEPHRPGGRYLGWQWIRYMTPFINLYAAIFLIGGALWSSARFARSGLAPWRAAGTALIAAGALLPGFGGTMAKVGLVEGLYVGEALGIVLIWCGYELCVREPVTALVAAAGR